MPYNNREEAIPVINVAEKAFNYGISKPEIPEYITNNLKYSFYDWQKKAFEKFLTYQLIKEKENPNTPTHLMFNMATGTGKTLLMATTILYYYQQGYRHILFFVNRNNIVDKTENNFIDSTHTKHLFTEKIIINDKTVPIKKVPTFSDNPQGIEIKFTSIQKLYNDIHIERENQTTLDDLHRKDIIMLADEAHHLNATTKKATTLEESFTKELKGNTSEQDIERLGWEHTVIDLILHKNNTSNNNKNVLLEFTATIPDTKSIAEKYKDKTLYQFGLKEFLQAGYTKEINLISSTLPKKERVLQALLMQWYRHSIALKNGIANFKPVILFRSKTIEESKTDYADFLRLIEDLSSNDFTFINTITDTIHESQQPYPFEQGKSRTEQVLEYINTNNIHVGEITEWIQQSYQERNTIITNSKSNTTNTEKTDDETEALLNSLEDTNNHIRAIFTVERLTEGWDVLNLFDIVRMYQGQNAGGSNRKVPEATIKEKQLIGRGVRYFPFAYNDTIKNKRKFDNHLNHELRVLEELYYYTHDEHSRYISHLKEELKKDGYIRDDKVVKTFALKQEFKDSLFYETTKIWYNKQIDNPNRKKKPLNDITKNLEVTYTIASLELHEEKIDFDKKQDTERLNVSQKKLQTILLQCSEIEKHIFLKAMNIKANQENSLCQFKQLQQELDITSIDELQTQTLAKVSINITVENNMQYQDIPNTEKLALTKKLLDAFFTELKAYIIPKKGSEFRTGNFKQFFSTPKTKTIDENNIDDTITTHDWYVLDSFVGTSEEKELIEFIKTSIGNLEEKYEKIKLLKNEEIYKIYDFEQGRGFQPDFLLFLKDREQQELYYQIFIEPKGNQFIDSEGTFERSKEGWKEEFLKEITKKYGLTNILQAEHFRYRLIGLPFFNKNNTTHFEKEYQQLYH